MENLTVSIPDPDLARARKVAADRGTTVNAMVRAFLAREVATIAPEQQEAIDWMVNFGNSHKGGIALPLPGRDKTYAERLDRW